MRIPLAVAAATIVGLGATGCAAGESAVTTTPSTTAAIVSTTDVPVQDSLEPVTTVAPATTDRGSPSPGLGEPPARLDGTLDADEFAARLSSSHAAIVDTTATDDERAAAGVDYQLVLRQLANSADLDDAVLSRLEPSAAPAVERIVRARQFLQQRSASRPPQPLPDELPAWTVDEPEPIDALLAHYAEAEQLTGIAWYWLAAIHLQETRMGRIQGVSSAGAVGPMQFLPTTWTTCCAGDPTVPRDAIIGAATYLAQSGGPDDMNAAVYQYNPNDGYVAVVTAYAESLRDEPELYAGYHAFQVFFGSSAGTIRLPIGYSESAPIDAATYLTTNPEHAA
ncbi:MAG TPA: lytic transglycosylase domain-containing protein [Ilumatobacteraceae bacterium]|nr:lytic transglycosylase domain-containing protein [Ilumatobacteraceae bacterium]